MRGLLSLLAFVSCALCTQWANAERLVISQNQGSQTHSLAQGIVQEVYAELGIDVEFQQYPAMRGVVLANAGTVDGDVARIDGIERSYPNLIRVPTPIFQLRAYAYGLDERISVDDWSDLQGLRVGIIYGVEYMEVGTRGIERERYQRFDAMFNALFARRIDVAISSRPQVAEISVINQDQTKLHILGRPLRDAPLYHVLHKKHGELVSRVDRQLRSMQETGRLDELYQSLLANVQDD